MVSWVITTAARMSKASSIRTQLTITSRIRILIHMNWENIVSRISRCEASTTSQLFTSSRIRFKTFPVTSTENESQCLQPKKMEWSTRWASKTNSSSSRLLRVQSIATRPRMPNHRRFWTQVTSLKKASTEKSTTNSLNNTRPLAPLFTRFKRVAKRSSHRTKKRSWNST